MARQAVFLDRDNTIIDDPGYLNDPDAVRLLPGAAAAIRRLNDAGLAVVVVTNQSGIARGRITEKQLSEVHERLREVLLEQGARIDAIYYCPYLAGTEATVPRFRKESEMRKPNPGMLLRAAEEHELALNASWMIGDSSRDVTAGRRAGCRTVLLDPQGTGATGTNGLPDYVAKTLADAVELVLNPPKPQIPEPDPSAAESSSDTGDVDTRTSANRASIAQNVNEMREMLRRIERGQRQDDFSVARLVATLMQMLAVVTGGWGVVRLIGGGNDIGNLLLLAVFLQLIAITALLAGRR